MSGYTPNPYHNQQPVNFEEREQPYDLSRNPSTAFTAYTSGITVSHEESLNSRGQTQAQSFVEEYRGEAPVMSSPDKMRPSSTLSSRQPKPSSNGHLSYVDEHFNVYSSTGKRDTVLPTSKESRHSRLDSTDLNDEGRGFHNLEYADAPPQPKESAFSRFLQSGRYPIEQRVENKKRGIPRQKYPVVTWVLTVSMVAVFIYELVKNNEFQGTPISMRPFPNYMLGPSQTALITFGARFPPCMKSKKFPHHFWWDALKTWIILSQFLARLKKYVRLVGFMVNLQTNDFGERFRLSLHPRLNQYRFITPIWLHAGIIHLALNMLAQWVLSGQVEQEMGSTAFLLVYFAGGVFGNVFGGNFSLVGVPSVGASGAIFGCVGTLWVDLLAHWQLQHRPGVKLVVLIVELIIGIAFGYIPGVDNFAHIGGFLMGLLCAMIFYPIISLTKRHKAIIWICRLGAVALAIVLYFVLIHNFYTGDPYAACSWCRYLSCIPTSSNNQCKGTGISTP